VRALENGYYPSANFASEALAAAAFQSGKSMTFSQLLKNRTFLAVFATAVIEAAVIVIALGVIALAACCGCCNRGGDDEKRGAVGRATGNSTDDYRDLDDESFSEYLADIYAETSDDDDDALFYDGLLPARDAAASGRQHLGRRRRRLAAAASASTNGTAEKSRIRRFFESVATRLTNALNGNNKYRRHGDEEDEAYDRSELAMRHLFPQADAAGRLSDGSDGKRFFSARRGHTTETSGRDAEASREESDLSRGGQPRSRFYLASLGQEENPLAFSDLRDALPDRSLQASRAKPSPASSAAAIPQANHTITDSRVSGGSLQHPSSMALSKQPEQQPQQQPPQQHHQHAALKAFGVAPSALAAFAPGGGRRGGAKAPPPTSATSAQEPREDPTRRSSNVYDMHDAFDVEDDDDALADDDADVDGLLAGQASGTVSGAASQPPSARRRGFASLGMLLSEEMSESGPGAGGGGFGAAVRYEYDDYHANEF
jgi:hypothetical protein